ncbi:hypothetical protein J4G52_25090 [Burkholderia cenocepacia]|uniref:hypothetical protein n=1 Tax=Burkholderia cenocepacia TaxID=95486 RepID=UPI001AA0B206|nr:hypothetical protein [Burkholderia cenocepacia]MBO1856818.1 hypothetical protein [Burkholderia cenocepacia]
MTLDDVVSSILEPALAVLPTRFDTPQARVMLLAIGLQESGFMREDQVGGPARSYWQFEINGVKAVMSFAGTAALSQLVARHAGIQFDAHVIYSALDHNDQLACQFARLLLWSAPGPLPALGASDAAWALYQSCWRPGKPRPADWLSNYQQALATVSDT